MPNHDDAWRLKQHWKQGKNHFSCFFAVLSTIRSEMGDDVAFTNWCFDNLHLGLDVITKASGVLEKVDAALAKKQFTAARKATRGKKRKPRQLLLTKN